MSEQISEGQSAFRPPLPKRRHPADDLPERITLMRRFGGGGEPPTIGQLQRHAERFGIGGVVETAIELGHSLAACVRLQDTCDRLDAAEQRRQQRGRTRQLPLSEDRVKKLMGLDRAEAEAEAA